MEKDAARSLGRLLPRLEATFAAERAVDPRQWDAVKGRLDAHFGALFEPLRRVYGGRYDFFFHLERFLELAVGSAFARPEPMRRLDEERGEEPGWFVSERIIGAVCYVDRFAGDLDGVSARIPYFRELGLTYLHLMPLFAAPAGNSDGGYAVSSYRDVDPALGTMAELTELAAELRVAGISLVLDFVFNHTSDKHAWAKEARADPDDEERNAYLMFTDRTMPDAYDLTLREIFPDQRRGSFSWRPEIGAGGRWVWTTFNSFQWDLNYANPEVFRRMAGEMLFLANAGVEILRLDAVAFVWKRLGTVCESLPEAHLLVRAFNAMARIAAPALLFKSEAIVHPAEVASYIDPAECQLSYNPLLMALLWESLATRNASLLRRSMAHWFPLPAGCAWVNYVRSHDDIGWTFDDADAAALGIDGYDHRRFLNAFYTGRFPGSFARGLPFQENPETGDARISGTAASLAGLEKAIREEVPAEVDLAVGRILALHSVALSIGGIPLLYIGDETATLNDYGYADDPDHAGDSRWVHRPIADAARRARRHDPATVEGRVFAGLRRMIEVRAANSVFAGSGLDTAIVDPANDHVFAYVRHGGPGSGERLLALVNVTERPQTVPANTLRIAELAYEMVDLLEGRRVSADDHLTLGPYQAVWLRATRALPSVV
ncbi:MAG: amylosucrase [Thermomicrobiales bacterium]